jgi:toxin ParE1/3/4
MARYRLARSARRDIADILDTSAARWGLVGRQRYSALIASAIRAVAQNPTGVTTRSRSDLSKELRSFHIRHARAESGTTRVQNPVHVLYYRSIDPDLIEIVRVLHERMEPSRQMPD